MDMIVDNRAAELYRLEEELAQLEARVRQLRAQGQGEPVGRYVFRGWDGEAVALDELFGIQDRLIMIHNMGVGCRYCSMWADGLNGLLPYLRRFAAVAMLNHDPVERQKSVAVTRGWGFRMLDASGTTFFADQGFQDPQDGSLLPGLSTFVRASDGTVRRYAKAFFGPHDRFCPTFSILELLPPDAEEAFAP